MDIKRISSFSDGNQGGNPAGVVLLEAMPTPKEMQSVAAKVGYSETAFASTIDSNKRWRVRYFSPEHEVPFCGHATVALGAALAETYGPGVYDLELNDVSITVEGFEQNGSYSAALQSPKTDAKPLPGTILRESLALFGFAEEQLSNTIKPALINGGASHILLPLNNRNDLANMNYKLDQGKALMVRHNVATIMLVVQEKPNLFHVRNAFASGGVYEDPATGAAAAAFSGYLRDSGILSSGNITLIQGEDMDARSVIHTEFSSIENSSIRVFGATRKVI